MQSREVRISNNEKLDKQRPIIRFNDIVLYTTTKDKGRFGFPEYKIKKKDVGNKSLVLNEHGWIKLDYLESFKHAKFFSQKVQVIGVPDDIRKSYNSDRIRIIEYQSEIHISLYAFYRNSKTEFFPVVPIKINFKENNVKINWHSIKLLRKDELINDQIKFRNYAAILDFCKGECKEHFEKIIEQLLDDH